MREILFRAKDTFNEEWVEGYYEFGYDAETEKPSHYMWVLNHTEKYGEMFMVLPETVGQYTGLTDKNGKKIFEGDIVSTDIARPYLIVEFRDGCFMFNCNDGGEDYYDIMLPICKEPHNKYEYGEVIGNIHDNPELMEEKV